eukprot:13926292-Ditylum_brightwellii.AAC.1
MPSVPSARIKNFPKKHVTNPYVSTLKHATPTKPTVAYAPPKKPNIAHATHTKPTVAYVPHKKPNLAHTKAYAAPKTNYITPTKTYSIPITLTHKDIPKKDYDFEFPLVPVAPRSLEKFPPTQYKVCATYVKK